MTDGAAPKTWAGQEQDTGEQNPGQQQNSEQEQNTVRAPVRRPWLYHRRLAFGIELLALLPAIAMAFEVAGAPRLQQLDYWSVLLRITNPDGGFRWGGVWNLHNEHPLIVPSFLYWVDAKYFGGDNRMLGYLTVVIAAGTVVLLRHAMPRILPDVLRAGLVVAASALVFSLHGYHNFALGMSGTAWLTANLLVITSLVLAMKRQWLPAWLAGLVACLSYGTAFAVWPALFLIAVLHGEPLWRRLTTLGIGAVVIAEWLHLQSGLESSASAESDGVGTLLHAFVTLLGHLWTGSSAGLAVIAGGAVLCGLLALLTVPAARTRLLWFWWALALYGVLACGMIAAARVDFGNGIGLASRYTSLSVLTSLPLLVIGVTVLFRRAPRNASRLAIAVGVTGLVGFTIGAPTVTAVGTYLDDAPLKAVALRAELDHRFWYGIPRTDRLAPRLEALDHYPFTDDYTIGCGGPELGDRLDVDEMRPMPEIEEDQRRPAGAVDEFETHGDTTLMRGWATGGRSDVRCVLVVDAEGRVTGGGQYHLPRPDVVDLLDWVPSDTGFAVVAPTDPAGRLVVVLEDDWLFWLPTPTTTE
ncbi:hypothetical protein [Actinophytocola glycyrrhizae]|uniref:Glycosyltransferase RgtA/B/C/D-like domain-containing protein n=1 Tax=Actinophytocola glycyrrhizae TaxID=2044873 RepID=A0ABV9S306_9PSEU